jgi:hypothetical protein
MITRNKLKNLSKGLKKKYPLKFITVYKNYYNGEYYYSNKVYSSVEEVKESYHFSEEDIIIVVNWYTEDVYPYKVKTNS